MRYLVSKYNLPDHWYPSNPEHRARVDEYLDWHQMNTRAGAAGYFANQVDTSSDESVYIMCVLSVCHSPHYGW